MECSAASRTEVARTSRLLSATTGISRAASPEMTPGGRFTAVPPTTGLAATITPGFVFSNAITYAHFVRLPGTAGGLTCYPALDAESAHYYRAATASPGPRRRAARHRRDRRRARM